MLSFYSVCVWKCQKGYHSSMPFQEMVYPLSFITKAKSILECMPGKFVKILVTRIFTDIIGQLPTVKGFEDMEHKSSTLM